MFGHKIKLDDALYDKLKTVAGKGGYSSVEEFVRHILEKTVAEVDEAASEEEVRKRLEGLGYLG